MSEGHTETPIDTEKDGVIKAIELLPTEFRCFDIATPGFESTDDDMRLKDLERKVEHTLHEKAGHASIIEQGASAEEMQEFADLLRKKASEYSQFASLLETISNPK